MNSNSRFEFLTKFKLSKWQLATFENFIQILRIRSGKKFPRVVKHSLSTYAKFKARTRKTDGFYSARVEGTACCCIMIKFPYCRRGTNNIHMKTSTRLWCCLHCLFQIHAATRLRAVVSQGTPKKITGRGQALTPGLMLVLAKVLPFAARQSACSLRLQARHLRLPYMNCCAPRLNAG
jgi:hypothetical protein